MSRSEKITLLSILIGAVFATIAAVVVALTYQAPPVTKIVTVEMKGGLCVDGNVWSTVYHLYDDGTVEYEDESGSSYKISPTLVDQIKTEIDNPAVLSELNKDPNPDCPSYYDGQDTIYTFPTISDKQYSICEYENSEDIRLFNLLNTI